MAKLHLGFLCSHGGSNMQAIIDNVKVKKLNAELCVVISNNKSAMALQRAKNENIPNYIINENTHPSSVDKEIMRVLKQHNVDTVVLAGYMKMLANTLLNSFHGRVLNIHPSLLPKFGGKGMYGIHVHEAVIAAKETKSGATIHLVNAEYDKGKILAQKEVEVLPNDIAETLAARVLQVEHILYSDTLMKISSGEIIL